MSTVREWHRAILGAALLALGSPFPTAAGPSVHGQAGPQRAPQLTAATAVGSVTANGARFRVCLDGPGRVTIEASTDRTFSSTVRGPSDSARASREFVVLIPLGGLQADTRYYYRVVIDGTPDSQVRSFLTFPTPGSNAPFTFAFGSCQQSAAVPAPGSRPGRVFRQVVRANARFFLQIGDWGYPDSTDRLPSSNDFFAAEFGRLQRSYVTKFNPDYLMDTLLQTTPVDYVYDDHDFMNDNAAATSAPFALPFKPNAFGEDFVIRDIPAPAGTRENAIRGYQENFPAYPLPNPARGIYHSFRFGSAEFFMLDLRAQRSPTLEGFRKDPATGLWEYAPPPGHSILGRDAAPGTGPGQLTWLLNGLKNSTATWKFLVSSVPFNRGQAVAIALSILLQDSTVRDPRIPAGARAIAVALELADKWVGFPADIDTLLAFLRANRIGNVVVLSGDSHTAAMDDGANAGLPELMAGNLDIANSRSASLLGSAGIRIWNRGGQGLSTSVFNNAFGKVTVFGRDSVRLALVDEEGVEFAAYTRREGTTDLEGPAVQRPGTFWLEQNYPNPFNPATTITYRLPAGRHIRLSVYDLLGREVATLVDEPRQAGTYTAFFDARALSSGVYICRLSAGGFQMSRRMLMLR